MAWWPNVYLLKAQLVALVPPTGAPQPVSVSREAVWVAGWQTGESPVVGSVPEVPKLEL